LWLSHKHLLFQQRPKCIKPRRMACASASSESIELMLKAVINDIRLCEFLHISAAQEALVPTLASTLIFTTPERGADQFLFA